MAQDSNNGWIELHRAMLENPIVMKSGDHCAVWICLLLLATHTERDVIFDGKRITLKPGQLITSRKSLKSLFKTTLNESKVQRILKSFEIEHQIEQQTCSKNRLITIVNWETYQKSEQQSEHEVNTKRTPSEHQVNTNNNDNNDNNVISNIYIAHFEETWKAYPKKRDKGAAYKAYMARINSGFSEEELFIATKGYADECKRENRPEKYIKNGSTFFGVNTPFIDYIPKRPDKATVNANKIFDLNEQYIAPYFGFPQEWFDGDKLIKERVVPVIRPRKPSMGWYEDTEISASELIEDYEARRGYYEQTNNGC